MSDQDAIDIINESMEEKLRVVDLLQEFDESVGNYCIRELKNKGYSVIKTEELEELRKTVSRISKYEELLEEMVGAEIRYE